MAGLQDRHSRQVFSLGLLKRRTMQGPKLTKIQRLLRVLSIAEWSIPEFSWHHADFALDAICLQVAMQFCPSRESFYTKLGSGYSPEDLMMLLSKVEPVLKENHEFLVRPGLPNCAPVHHVSLSCHDSSVRCPALSKLLVLLRFALSNRMVFCASWSLFCMSRKAWATTSSKLCNGSCDCCCMRCL